MTIQIATGPRFPLLLLAPLLLLVPLIAAGCHAGSAGPGTDDLDDADVDVDGLAELDGGSDSEVTEDAATVLPLWNELSAPALNVAGGTALASEGIGANGGLVWLRSDGGVTIDAALSVAPNPSIPTAGVALVAADLAADVTRAGTVRIDSMITASGSDSVRIITSTGGDIIVTGTLRGADLGAATQSLVLRAPAGTVYVSGTVDSGGGDSTDDGDAAGGIEISADSVVVTGQLIAAGEASTTQGGAGGAIAITADELLSLSGTIDTFGGDGRGQDDVRGGGGGAITLVAGADLDLLSTVRLRGGAASAAGTGATGGAAALLKIDAEGVARLRGIIDGRGGLALGGGVVTGGTAGSVRVGDQTQPIGLEIAQIVTIGGSGFASGGHGGAVDVLAKGGNLVLAATIQTDGGDSLRRAGNAGAVTGVAGWIGGGIQLSSLILGKGGAVMAGGSADGGTGAVVRLNSISTAGNLDVTTTGGLRLDGGAASTGRGGNGGDIEMKTYDGNASIAGELIARGGVAQAAGGTGGILELFTDANFNGIGGNLTIESTGLIDVSAGAGTIGGDARNNGGAGVAIFPTYQTQLAVLLNTDGVHGSPQDGGLLNLGLIVAHGGSGNGSGGDIMFHGRHPGSYIDPLPGMVSLDGDGSGRTGDFVAE